jgi:protein involved in ribonucleotide reduction
VTEKNILVVYYSSRTENTHRFVQKLGLGNICRLEKGAESPLLDEEFILICPSYGGGAVKGSIPPEVYALLNVKGNREKLIGVIGSGNTNFGTMYCHSAKMISEKCNVPLLYKFELMGSITDVNNIKRGVESLGNNQQF